MSENPFHKRFTTLPTERLVRITLEPHNYEPEAVEAAQRELESRGTQIDTIDTVRAAVNRDAAAEQVRADRQEDRKRKVHSHVTLWIDAINPLRNGPLTSDQRIRIVVVLLTILFLFEVITVLQWIPMLQETKMESWGTVELYLLAAPVLMVLCIVLYYRHTTVGWIGTVLWAAIGASMLLQGLMVAIPYYWGMDYYIDDPYGIGGLLELFAPSHPVRYLGSLLWYGAILWLTADVGVRDLMVVGPTERAVTYTVAAGFACVHWFNLI